MTWKVHNRLRERNILLALVVEYCRKVQWNGWLLLSPVLAELGMSAGIMMFCSDQCKLLWFFSQMKLISVITIAPSSLHWGAVPLLCSHEGTLASLRSCCCLCSYTGNRALENVFFDLGRVFVGQTPLGGFSLSAGAQLFKGGRKEPRTPPH